MTCKKIFLLFILMLFLSQPMLIFAETNGTSTNMDYIVFPDIPDNQEKGIKGYLSLNMKPNQKQNVKVNIKNISNKEITLKIVTANGMTALKGDLFYDNKNSEISKITAPKFEMKNNIHIQDIVTVPPKEIISVPVTLQAPSESTGVYLGGILFTPVRDKQEKINLDTLPDSGISVQANIEVSFLMAVQFNMPSQDAPELLIDEAKINIMPSSVDVNVQIVNDTSTIVKKVNGKYEVLNNNDEVLFKGEIKDFDFAPRSEIYYPLKWNADKLSPGKYKLSIQLTYNGENEIKFVKKNILFEVENKQLKDYQESIGVKPVLVYTDYKLIVIGVAIIIFALLLVVGICIIFVRYRKKKDKKNERYKPMDL